MSDHFSDFLFTESGKEYFHSLTDFLDDEYKSFNVYPPRGDIFNAMRYTDLSDVKAVIIGQDPYHEMGQAHGLAFSVKPGVKIPPSLRNIFKELKSDLGIDTPDDGCLIPWAMSGVLLLNTVLTVRDGEPGSHRGVGWEIFTDALLKEIDMLDRPIVFLLWGRDAAQKRKLIKGRDHLVLEAAHPSPLSASRGFFGCRHFSKTNGFLISHGVAPIDWRLDKL